MAIPGFIQLRNYGGARYPLPLTCETGIMFSFSADTSWLPPDYEYYDFFADLLVPGNLSFSTYGIQSHSPFLLPPKNPISKQVHGSKVFFAASTFSAARAGWHEPSIKPYSLILMNWSSVASWYPLRDITDQYTRCPWPGPALEDLIEEDDAGQQYLVELRASTWPLVEGSPHAPFFKVDPYAFLAPPGTTVLASETQFAVSEYQLRECTEEFSVFVGTVGSLGVPPTNDHAMEAMFIGIDFDSKEISVWYYDVGVGGLKRVARFYSAAMSDSVAPVSLGGMGFGSTLSIAGWISSAGDTPTLTPYSAQTEKRLFWDPTWGPLTLPDGYSWVDKEV
jgi:hypothetical protein